MAKEISLYGIRFTALVVDVLLCALNCGDTIGKAESTLFSAITTLCFCLGYPVIILRLYAGPSSEENRSSIIEVLSETDIPKILTLVLKNDNEGTLA